MHWKLLATLKTSKEVYEVINVFDMSKYVYSQSVFNTLYIELKQKSVSNPDLFLYRTPKDWAQIFLAGF